MASNQGRYQIVERLDAGGMAEVFKANAVSLQGFEKLVAIKKVLPGLTEDDRFTRMFLDEARLSLHLNHANIVQVFDVQQGDDGSYFIVMQFIDGANLKKLLNILAERGARLPVELSLFIAMEACKGLHYAHTRRGADGASIGIVHRDISPPNILISREGEVKIMDFGLAKGTTNLEKTDPGVVKGKFGYLSPEAAYGEEVDARTDVFAVGIVLWEMLTGERLFQGESDYETLQLVRKAEVPSVRQRNSDVSTELEAIVRKSLARDKNQRYSTAQELGAALTQHLFSRGLTVAAYDLAALVQRLIGVEGSSRPKRDELSAIDMVLQDYINTFHGVAQGGGGGGGGEGLFGGDANGGLGTEEIWGDVFGDIQQEMAELSSMQHIPSGGTRRLEAVQRAPEPAAAPAAAPRASANPSTNPSAPPAATPSTPPRPRPAAAPAATPGAPEEGSSKTLWIVFGALLVAVLLGVGFLVVKILMAPPAA